MDYAFKLSKRDLEIWEKFNGRNHAQLAREYKVSANAIYRIVKRTQKKALKAAQPELF